MLSGQICAAVQKITANIMENPIPQAVLLIALSGCPAPMFCAVIALIALPTDAGIIRQKLTMLFTTPTPAEYISPMRLVIAVISIKDNVIIKYALIRNAIVNFLAMSQIERKSSA
jgi:hypothetical protein